MKNEPTSSPATIDQDIAPEIKPPTSQFEVLVKKDQNQRSCRCI